LASGSIRGTHRRRSHKVSGRRYLDDVKDVWPTIFWSHLRVLRNRLGEIDKQRFEEHTGIHEFK